MTNCELKEIYGGISGVVINAIIKAFEFTLELGRSLGSAIRRKKDKTKC